MKRGSGSSSRFKTGRNSIGVELDTEYCRMAASRLVNENTSLFSKADFQIQLHPVSAGHLATGALQETPPPYRAKQGPRKARPQEERAIAVTNMVAEAVGSGSRASRPWREVRRSRAQSPTFPWGGLASRRGSG
jgi:hypothetical protein